MLVFWLRRLGESTAIFVYSFRLLYWWSMDLYLHLQTSPRNFCLTRQVQAVVHVEGQQNISKRNSLHMEKHPPKIDGLCHSLLSSPRNGHVAQG